MSFKNQLSSLYYNMLLMIDPNLNFPFKSMFVSTKKPDIKILCYKRLFKICMFAACSAPSDYISHQKSDKNRNRSSVLYSTINSINKAMLSSL